MGAVGLYGPSDVTRIPSERKPDLSRSRSPLRRDYARLIHSAAFRRLQGKTQLFAGLESDFFRNRLTHSLEVAQIAEGIGLRLNAGPLHQHDAELDLHVLRFSGLAHDLGHPPFGHTGEHALDRKMREYGGFEGNAQTLRILTRLEKKLDDAQRQLGQDNRPLWYRDGRDVSWGLNLCARSLAAIVKYDRAIPNSRDEPVDKPVKGYYRSESPLVQSIKQKVLGSAAHEDLYVVECQIMDLADDIAYSTYDIEDAFKGGLLNPVDLRFPTDEVLGKVARRAERELSVTVQASNVEESLRRIFGRFDKPSSPPPTHREKQEEWFRLELAGKYRTAQEVADKGFFRTALTSRLVNRFVEAVEIDWNPECPPLSKVKMDPSVRLEIAVLKHLTYVLLIESPRFNLVAYRGTQIVDTIFDALVKNPKLLPQDVQERYEQAEKDPQQRRVICDFIAGMTDRYAVEFYARLTSDDFHTMFKPL